MKSYPVVAALSILFMGSVLAYDWPTIKKLTRNSFPRVSHIFTDSLAVWIESDTVYNPVILDVREVDEFEVSRLPGALRARTLEDALNYLEDMPKDTLIVAYCSVGYRSSELAADLMDQGFTNVYNLEGSIFEWANKGLPVYNDSLEVRAVHPFDEEWGTLLNRDLWAPDIADSTSGSGDGRD